jgi:tetratricopeptide (TPR) repeat protein
MRFTPSQQPILKGDKAAMTPFKTVAAIAILAISAAPAWAGDVLTIKIPRHSELTPVQKLNREGVEAVKKQRYDKAAELFYKAYLYDPADPFTLNNLGYISELQGELDRAHKFYALAAEQECSANIDDSNAKGLKGKSMQVAFESLQDVPMRVNRLNVNAMDLLSQGEARPAIALLRQALPLDPQNPFTLNNLGVAHESIGDYDSALKFYAEASASKSSELAVVTLDQAWRGKSVSAMASASEKRLKDRMKKMDSTEAHAVIFTMRGVSAMNANDWTQAKEDFLHAYSLDPSSAFSLNNRGYVAEMDGDLETAQFYYDKARKADDANARVGLATQSSAEGKRLFTVALDSDHQVDGELDRYSQQRRRETGPIELTPRGKSSAGDSDQQPATPSPSTVPPAAAPSVPQR